MTPFARAAELWLASGTRWPFSRFVEAHAQSGMVFITPDLFALVRPVGTDWSTAELNDPLLVSTDPDCWHIGLAAGDVSSLPRLLPFLPWISYHRRGRLRRIQWTEACRLAAGSRTATASRATVAADGQPGCSNADQSPAAARPAG